MSSYLTLYLNIVTGLLLVILLAGLVRVMRGPTIADRMLVSQLFGTAGVAILMLLATVQQQTALLNTALVLALLAPLTMIAFVTLAGKK
jgi:multicomponent Na+:H+ antiporter subunit F